MCHILPFAQFLAFEFLQLAQPARDFHAYRFALAGKRREDVLEQRVDQFRLALAETNESHPFEGLTHGRGDLRWRPGFGRWKSPFQKCFPPRAHATDPLAEAADGRRDDVVEQVLRAFVEEGVAPLQRGRVEPATRPTPSIMPGENHECSPPIKPGSSSSCGRSS